MPTIFLRKHRSEVFPSYEANRVSWLLLVPSVLDRSFSSYVGSNAYALDYHPLQPLLPLQRASTRTSTLRKLHCREYLPNLLVAHLLEKCDVNLCILPMLALDLLTIFLLSTKFSSANTCH
jgi:hypothetical protein